LKSSLCPALSLSTSCCICAKLWSSALVGLYCLLAVSCACCSLVLLICSVRSAICCLIFLFSWALCLLSSCYNLRILRPSSLLVSCCCTCNCASVQAFSLSI
jgi:hypothetical protein